MIINEITSTLVIILSVFSISSSKTIGLFSTMADGTSTCNKNTNCNYNEICHVETINNAKIGYCIRDCRFPHPHNMKCVDPLADLFINCNSSMDCEWDKKCVEGKCVKACQLLSCGPNASCKTLGHIPKCYCYYGYQGDPYELSEGCTSW